MKIKILALFAAVLVISISIAYAATPTAPSINWVVQDTDGTITFPAATTNGPLVTFRPSANVVMSYDCGDGVKYTVGSYHKSGVKIYASSSGDAKIYMFDLPLGPPGEIAPTTKIPAYTTVTPAGSTGWGAGWTALK